MENELLKNGYVSFDIKDEEELNLLSLIYDKISKDNFHTLKVSYNDIKSDHYIPYDSFSNLNKVKNELLTKDNLAQIWFVTYDKSNEVSNLLKSVFLKYYNNTDIQILDSITLYNEGCFIVPHIDGKDPKRIAGILIYLNKNYNEENGGNLILKNEIKVVPEYGRVVIIDYTQNSVEHEVTKLITGERYAICAFIHKK